MKPKGEWFMYIKVPSYLETLADIFEQRGYPLYIVGGYIRNAILGLNDKDIDICSKATPNDVRKILRGTKYSVSVKNERLGVIAIHYENEYIEHATFREEVYEVPGIHTPTSVNFVESIEEDYSRRDFSCNAIYYRISTREIIDPAGGVADLQKRIVKTCTLPRLVFQNDGIRILRMVRFACSLTLNIDPETFAVAKQNVFRLKFISKQTIRDEFSRIIQADIEYPELPNSYYAHSRGLFLIGELGAWKYVIPEIARMKESGLMANKTQTLYTHTLTCAEVSAPEVRLSALLHDIGKLRSYETNGTFAHHAEIGSALIPDILGEKGLNYSNDIVRRVTKLIACHKFDEHGVASKKSVKLFIIENYRIFPLIIMLKHATTIAKNPNVSSSKIANRWQNIYQAMVRQNVPFEKKYVAVNGAFVMKHFPSLPKYMVSECMNFLHQYAVLHPRKNKEKYLYKQAQKFCKQAHCL